MTPPDPTPNIFTNFPRVKPSDSVTVLLLDSLNTPLDDQSFVREQMLKYLKKANPGHRMAIFTLGTQLRLLQSFTDDPTLLTAAINNRKNGAGPETSTLLQSNAETAATQETSQALMLYAPEAAESIRQFAAEQDSERGEVRLKLTLEALQELAHYLAAIPGRKNIAWFSGAFPVAIVPDPTLPQEFGVQRDNQEEVHKTDALLASAQVAIYPIAAEGVGLDSSSSAATDPRMTQPQLLPGDATANLQPSQPGYPAAQRQPCDHGSDRERHGRGAFYGTNSLTDALDQRNRSWIALLYPDLHLHQPGHRREIQKDSSSAGQTRLPGRISPRVLCGSTVRPPRQRQPPRAAGNLPSSRSRDSCAQGCRNRPKFLSHCE